MNACPFVVGILAGLLLPGASAGTFQMRIDEILGGCGDAPAAQFVEISYPRGMNRWAGCARLEFRSAEGTLVGTFDFPSDPPEPRARNSALVATTEFARLPGAPRPDFLMPPLVQVPGGEVCFRSTGRRGCPGRSFCIAYGGHTAGPGALDPSGQSSIQWIATDVVNDPDRWQRTAPPSPRNGLGVSAAIHCTFGSLVEMGRRLFFEETFAGNGRTCGTCHPAEHAFTIGPAVVAGLPPGDPLFVAETVPALAGLERPPLLRGPRALVLENVDGFERHVFRGTPHLLNVGRTAPWGLSGDVDSLAVFSRNAVVQHFPRSLDRVPGVDFREPTGEELAALEAFMQTITAGDSGGLDHARLVLGPAARRGRDLFFGRARCAFCHGGPFLDRSPWIAFGFDTGVARQPANLVPPPECPECPAIGPLEGTREFDVPALVGVRDTAPFFHDNSAPTLRDAVAFYTSPSFAASPAGAIGGPIVLGPEEIDDVTAFLEALDACGNGIVDRGEACDDGNTRDGDCCSADCGAAAADGVACDDGDACTVATECRSGTCLVLDAGPCGGDTCRESDSLTAAAVTCAVANVADDLPQCGRRVRSKLARAMRMSDAAMDGTAAARSGLARAARVFDRAGRLSFRSAAAACATDVAVAAWEAARRARCLRRCVRDRVRLGEWP